MTIDLNKNGKDDIQEILDDMKQKFVAEAAKEDGLAAQLIAEGLAPVEEALGVDINGDGVIGLPKEQ